jgi:hypothetical protein
MQLHCYLATVIDEGRIKGFYQRILLSFNPGVGFFIGNLNDVRGSL